MHWLQKLRFEFVLMKAYDFSKCFLFKKAICVAIKTDFRTFGLQGKLKKMKEKYKDQDEEDKEIIMQLLGVRFLDSIFHELAPFGK